MIIVTTMFASFLLVMILKNLYFILSGNSDSFDQGFLIGTLIGILFSVFSFWTWTLR